MPSDVAVSRRYPLPDGRIVVSQYVDGFTDPTVTVARIDGQFEPAIGDRVWISFSPDDSHVFDPATEQQILTRNKAATQPA